MTLHWLSMSRKMSPASRRGRRPAVFEVLEDRRLLATFTVTSTADALGPAPFHLPVPGTLRWAVDNADIATSPSTIDFDLGSGPATITLALGALNLDNPSFSTAIDGPGTLFLAGGGTPGELTISGAGASQVFINSSNASISGLTISGGSAATGGGGVSNGGTLTLSDCTVTGNSVTGGAGSPFEGGGIYSKGSLTVTDCTITGNSVTDRGSTARYGGGGIGSTGPLTVTGCTVTGNSVTGSGSNNYGGGIDSTGLSKLEGCTITGNSVSGGNGNFGGGVDSEGSSTVTDCVITGNSNTGGDGGGLFSKASMTLEGCTIAHNLMLGGTGGGIANDSSMTMDECAVIDNTVTSGIGGGIINTNALTVADTAITGNSVTGAAGGVCNAAGTTEISNSTIAGNAASGIGGVLVAAGSLTAVNVTIAGNSSGVTNVTLPGPGSGMTTYPVVGGLEIALGTATLDNTIVALNTAGSAASDIVVFGAGQVTSASANNLIGTGGSGGLTNGVNGDQVGVADPGLGPLASNGGPTQTMALLPGSPAIDAGSNALAIDPANNHALIDDQRGSGFARVFNGTVDIGAYELEADAAVATVAVGWGTQTDALQTAADGLRLLPAGRSTDLPWLGIHELIVGFSEPVLLTAADVTIQDVLGIKYGPVTVTGSGTTYTIAFARPIAKADRVTISIAAPGITAFMRRLDVLPGDFDDNGVVNKKDVKGIRAEVTGKGGAQPTIFGDIIGDGDVDKGDVNAVRRRLGTRLPKVHLSGSAHPAFRTRARAIFSRRSPRPDVKAHGAHAADPVSWPYQF